MRRGPTLKQLYHMMVADALAHGERHILTYRQWLKVVRLQQRLARTDPGGNIRL